MPDGYPSWWANRFGAAGGATVTPSQPEPVYGLAADAALTPMSNSDFRGTVNEIETFAQDQNQQLGFAQQAQRPTPPSLNAIKDHIRFQIQQIEQDPDLGPGERKRQVEQYEIAIVEQIGRQRDQYGLTEDQISDLNRTFLGEEEYETILGIPRKIRLWDRLSGVDEETGLNRTERKWLTAQATQDAEISLQEDAELRPELRDAARRALETGEWGEDLARVWAESQSTYITKSLEWYDESIHEPVVENISAGVAFIDSLTPAFSLGTPLDSALEDGESWSDAWRRARDAANNVSFGQAMVDSMTQEFDVNREAYAEGFDEFGQPLNQAYYTRRQGAGYNVASGLTDFALNWYADPLVFVGKGAAGARTLTRADVAKMTPQVRNRFLTIATMPSDELANTRRLLGSKAHPWLNPVDARALAVREARDGLRDQVRAGTMDAVDLSQRAAFRDDPVATQFFVRSALVKKVDPTGRLTNEWDDDAFDLFTAASYGHGPALEQLATKGDEFVDLAKALEPRTRAIDADVMRVENALEEAITDPTLSDFQSFERATQAKFDLNRAIDERDLLRGEMDQYDSYHETVDRFLTSADRPQLRNARFNDERQTVALRTSSLNANGVTVTRYPMAAWRKRPGSADLTRGSDTVEAARRYAEQQAKYGSGDSLTAVAERRGAASWDELQEDFSRRLLAAEDDTARRRLMAEHEEIGIEAVVVKHGFDPDDAVRISNTVKDKRNSLMAHIMRQKEEMQRATAVGDEPPSSIFEIADGETLDITQLPMDPTELQNYYMPTDLRSLDSLLNLHGDSIKMDLALAPRVAGEFGTRALDKFNQFWKPSVLLRGGYPIRNVTDGQLRILALTGSFTTLGTGAQAFGIGTVNTGSRVLNQFPRLAGFRGRIPMIPQVGERAGATIKVKGREWAAGFAAQEADVIKAMNSSDEAQKTLFRHDLNTGREAMASLRMTRAGEEGHVGLWAKVLNERILKSPVWNRMLEGQTDDQIVKWLNNTTDGRALKRRLPWRSYDPVKWVDELRIHLDTYVPDDILRARLATRQPVDESFLQKMVDEGAHSPVQVDEAGLAMADGETKLGRWVGEKIDQAFHVLATLPEDTLVRNPFFRQQYRGRLAQSTAHLPKSQTLTPLQVRAYKQDARTFALKQTKRYLFTLTDQSDLTHFFRFMAPFGGAAMEAIRKWGRLFLEEPEAFSRLYVNGWNDIGDAAFWEKVDQNGLTEDDPGHGELDTLRMQIPRGLAKALLPDSLVETWAPELDLPPLKEGATPREADLYRKAREGAIGWDISVRSLNVSLQGDPWFIPGVGPMVQIPIGFKANDYPELADDASFRGMLYRYIYPTGVPEIADVLLPAAWMRNARRTVATTNDPTFTNMADNLAKQDYYNWIRGGRQGPPPDPNEAIDQHKGMMAFYTVARFGAPFAFSLNSPSQYFIDAARQYQDKFGYEEGFAKFVKDYGEDAQVFWTSNSDTIVEVPPTSSGWRAKKYYQGQVDQHPDLALAIVGLEASEDPFNYAVYAAQGREGMRERLQPEEALAKAQAGMGWNEWQQVNTAVQAELAARGLAHPGQAGAEDLELLLYNAREQIKDDYPGWAAEQGKFDLGRTYGMVDGIREILESGKSPVRPDWEGLAEYVLLHDTIAAELDARKAAGGSADLQAQSNSDARQVYENALGQLREKNLRFSDLFTRIGLDNHKMSNGSN